MLIITTFHVFKAVWSDLSCQRAPFTTRSSTGNVVKTSNLCSAFRSPFSSSLWQFCSQCTCVARFYVVQARVDLVLFFTALMNVSTSDTFSSSVIMSSIPLVMRDDKFGNFIIVVRVDCLLLRRWNFSTATVLGDIYPLQLPFTKYT